MTTVLAALDDSAAAAPVLVAAGAVAPLLGSTVSAVHVGSGAGGTARACAERAGVPFQEVPGDPADRLVELAAQGVTTVVGGARSRPVGHAPVGHLTLALADRLPVPLLVVPPQCAPAPRLRRVLVALEGTPGRAKQLRHAMRVVAGSELELFVVHVDGEDAVPRFSDSAAHEHEAFAQEFLARYWPEAPRARLLLRIGAAAEQVLAVTSELQPDLLVAGWPQGRGPEHGHVVREVLRHCPVPMLLVATA